MNETFSYGKHRLSVGFSSPQGNIQYKTSQYDADTCYVGLFDGGKGDAVAKFCAKFLHKVIREQEELLKSDDDDDEQSVISLSTAIKKGFLRIDQMIKERCFWEELNEGLADEKKVDLNISFDKTGSTVCAVFVRGNTLVTANAGLSRCVISRKHRTFTITTAHEPSVLAEMIRVNKAKSSVLVEQLADEDTEMEDAEEKPQFTRAIGYAKYKRNQALQLENQIIIANTEVKMVELKMDIDFVLLASDDFWVTCPKDNTIPSIIMRLLPKDVRLSRICQKIEAITDKTPDEVPNLMIILLKLETNKPQKAPEDSMNNANSVLFKQRSVSDLVQDHKTWERLKETYVLSQDKTPAEVLETLWIAQLEAIVQGNGDGPRYLLPTRPKRLYEYSSELKQVCLHRTGTYLTDPKKGVIIERCIKTVVDLLEKSEINSLRGMSYRGDTVSTHKQSAGALREVCMLTEATRSSLHIYGTPRGSISGPLVLVADGLRVDCEEGGVAGMNVPVEVEKGNGITKATPKEGSEIRFILVVEKKSVFLLLMELDFPKKHKCVLITGSGMPDVATRTAICKLHELLGVPVYCFVDANAHGLRIYSIYKVGSRELFLENTGLALSSIELIGFLSEDVKEVNKSSRQLLSKNDKEVLKGMLEMKYLSEDLKKHVTYMQEYGFKAQIEAIQDDHGSAALEEYITRKIAALEEGMLE